MTQTATQAGPVAIPAQMQERLRVLGIATAIIAPDGGARPVDATTDLARLVMASPPFAAAVRQHWAELTGQDGHVVALWPGVSLLPLFAQRRRRASSASAAQTVPCAVLLDRDLFTAEQMRAVCDAARLDFEAVRRRGESANLLHASDVSAVTQLIAWMNADTVDVTRRYDELQAMSQQLGESYEELSLLYKFSANMAVDQPPVQFLNQALADLQQVAEMRWLGMQLIDDDPRLRELAGQTFAAGGIDADHPPLQQLGRQLTQRHGGDRQAVVVTDATKTDIPHLADLTRDLLVVPIRHEDKPLGILFGGEKLSGDHITSVDSKLCSSLANTMAMFLGNIMLYDDMQSMFMGTLHALTSSIDAKDRYTRGHSERVALMSRMLTEAAGFDSQTVERVYLAGLVHDVGKIGVPESVLTKPGPLSDEEFGLIKQHPEIGGHILEDIRQMEDLIPGVMYHHERFDGRGYPHGLSGRDIPLFGRLICLADSFDAMSSNRAYRKALDLPAVLGEIERCAGTQFDPDLAKVFVKLDFAAYFDMMNRHQRQEQAGDSALEAFRRRLASPEAEK